MTASQDSSYRLITISVSHYCEKVRWALTRLNLPYVEEPHMPPFHRWATGRVGGKSVPVLVSEAGVWTDSTEILRHLDTIAPADAKLYPADPALGQQVKEWEELCNTRLGPAVRRWAYFYLLDDQKYIQSRWCEGVPLIERALFPVTFPAMRSLARRSIDITAESASEAYRQITAVFETVSKALGDGRTYLVGDQFSAADLTFAALAVPALRLAKPSLKYAESHRALIKQMTSEVKVFRNSPAGTYALHLLSARN